MPGELCNAAQATQGCKCIVIYKAFTAHVLWPDKYKLWHLWALHTLCLHEHRLPEAKWGTPFPLLREHGQSSMTVHWWAGLMITALIPHLSGAQSQHLPE